MKRSAIRELAFQLIYSLEIQKEENLEDQIELYLECNEVEEVNVKVTSLQDNKKSKE